MSPEVLDVTPEIEVGTPPVEDPTPDSGIETGVEGEEQNPPDGLGAPGAEPPIATDSPAIVDGKLSPSAKAELQTLAKTSPKLAKSIRAALFESDAMRKELPRGLKEVTELREQLNQFGGPEAIAKTREELSYFSDLDQQFTTGDPRFIQAMIDTPEGQQGFLKLAPAMLDKFRELSPEMHESYVAKQQYQGMLDSDLKFSIVRMRDAIDRMPDSPEKAAALEQWGPLASYYNGILEKANRKVEAPKPAVVQNQGADERAQLENDRAQFTRTQWSSEATSAAKSLIDAELSRIASTRKLTDTQKAAVLELGVGRLKKALAAMPNFNTTAQRHLASKDKAGFLRHVTSAYKQQIPVVLRAAADAIVAQKATPKIAATSGTPAAKPSAIPGSTAKPAEGFSWVNAMPVKTTIDFGKTNGEMIRNGRAILTGGRRVQWRQS